MSLNLRKSTTTEWLESLKQAVKTKQFEVLSMNLTDFFMGTFKNRIALLSTVKSSNFFACSFGGLSRSIT